MNGSQPEHRGTPGLSRLPCVSGLKSCLAFTMPLSLERFRKDEFYQDHLHAEDCGRQNYQIFCVSFGTSDI